MVIKELTYIEGATMLLTHYGRFTVLRPLSQESPMQELSVLLQRLLQGEAFAAAEAYHAFTFSLISGEYRRVSGDLFRDFLLWALLEHENSFSRLAAANTWDESMSTAMRSDLALLDSFFQLTSMQIKRWIGECARDQRKPKPQRDHISVMSSAVWAGGSSRPLPASPVPEPVATSSAVFIRELNENDLLSWRYQVEPGEQGKYIADSALEEIYRRVESAPSGHSGLLDDLWNFHATYGSGAFIKDRLFMFRLDGTLSAIPAQQLSDEDSFTFYQQQREHCLRNAIRFMQGEPYMNMQLTGAPGTGKTTQVFSLCRELPELRLIYAPPGTYAALAAFIPRLCAQPLKFLIFLDDFLNTDSHWPLLRATLAPAGIQPHNLLIAAASAQPELAFFPLHIQLPPPQLKDFMELVQLLLLREGRDVDFDRIQNACIDYAASAGASGVSPLSFRSAEIIASDLNTLGRS